MKNLINDVATEARALLNGILADCDTDDTTGTCLFASLLLARLAHSKGFSAVIRGGDGKSDGGLFTMYGGFGHYWCEISNNDEFHIVDISADQFGFEGVIVKNIKEVEGWPRYIPGNQDVVNAGVEELFNHGY